MMHVSCHLPGDWAEPCKLCGEPGAIDLSGAGDSLLCPGCGHLFCLLREHLVRAWRVEPRKVQLSARLEQDLGADSLDMVQLGLEFEHRLAVHSVALPEDESRQVKTVADAVRLMRRMRREVYETPSPPN